MFLNNNGMVESGKFSKFTAEGSVKTDVVLCNNWPDYISSKKFTIR